MHTCTTDSARARVGGGDNWGKLSEKVQADPSGDRPPYNTATPKSCCIAPAERHVTSEGTGTERRGKRVCAKSHRHSANPLHVCLPVSKGGVPAGAVLWYCVYSASRCRTASHTSAETLGSSGGAAATNAASSSSASSPAGSPTACSGASSGAMQPRCVAAKRSAAPPAPGTDAPQARQQRPHRGLPEIRPRVRGHVAHGVPRVAREGVGQRLPLRGAGPERVGEGRVRVQGRAAHLRLRVREQALQRGGGDAHAALGVRDGALGVPEAAGHGAWGGGLWGTRGGACWRGGRLEGGGGDGGDWEAVLRAKQRECSGRAHHRWATGRGSGRRRSEGRSWGCNGWVRLGRD